MKRYRHFTRKGILWATLLVAGTIPSLLRAQEIADLLPAKFRLVKNAEEITPDGYYLIGAQYSVMVEGENRKGFCLLTDQPQGGGLLGVESEFPVCELLETEQTGQIWQLKADGAEGICLYAPEQRKGVAAGKTAVGLSLQDSDWLSWLLETAAGHGLQLRLRKDDRRFLGVNWMPESIRFGAYIAHKGPMEVRIYKMVRGADVPGEAVMPAADTALALYQNGRVGQITSDGKWFWGESRPHLLADGTVIPDKAIPSWYCRMVGNATFRLEDASGKGLELWTADIPERQVWTVDSGYVVTAELPRRYLVADEAQRLALVPKALLQEKQCSPVMFLNMGQPSAATVDDRGVLLLRGAWCAAELSALSWEGISAIDMTALSLPLAAEDFARRPDSTNALLLVTEESVPHCPASWKNLVACNAAGEGQLVRPMQLYDRSAWQLPLPVSVGSGQLTYHRNAFADGSWETICLPFDAALPAGFHAETFTGISPGGALQFAPVDRISANQPLIMRCIHSSQEPQVSFKVQATEGMLQPKIQDNALFQGTYLPIDVPAAAAQAVYFLNSAGTAFVRAAENSHLSPFRAYLKEGERETVKVDHTEGLTGMEEIQTLPAGPEEPMVCRTVDGRLVFSSLTPAQWEALPKGIYIVNGKKRIKN